MVRCLLFGHLWQFPTPEQKTLGVKPQCRWCGRVLCDDVITKPGSKHLPTRPEDKMIHKKETK